MDLPNPDLPNPPWHRPPRQRAVKPPLSGELIVTTALDILAAEGVNAVSMRRVAQALETGPSSLYAHVSNKDELDELMFDRILAGVPLPEPDPARWAEQIKELLGGQVKAMMAYPGIARVAWRTMVPVGPNILRHGEATLTLLRAGGFTIQQAAYAADALSLYTKAYAYEGSAWAFGEVDAELVARRNEQMQAYMNSFPANTFPNMLQVAAHFSAESAAERFTFALEIFLAGITQLTLKTSAASQKVDEVIARDPDR